ncbi:hypothetical protein [Paenibacillus sp. IHBB 10380]|uniref:hypothetical protein n=1 Tax=Paenibacillus sp. IHBB 10380 TaxID=1566358 RepID=UPI001364DD8D|nr:hypothetical protein [Paenibacillus sp. IHBB 10380]
MSYVSEQSKYALLGRVGSSSVIKHQEGLSYIVIDLLKRQYTQPKQSGTASNVSAAYAAGAFFVYI